MMVIITVVVYCCVFSNVYIIYWLIAMVFIVATLG